MMIKHSLLIFLLPLQLICQNLPVGFVNFSYKNVNGQCYFPEKGYYLYTSENFTNENYYGYIDYYWRKGRGQGPALRLHLNDSIINLDSIIPSIGSSYIATFIPENVVDTIYKANNHSYFTVLEEKGNKVRFLLNDNRQLWVQTEEYVNFIKVNDLLTKSYAYSNRTINLYSKPDTNALIKSDTRFSCFEIKEIRNKWAYVVTTKGDPCANYKKTKINDAWIIWYDKKILINPEPW